METSIIDSSSSSSDNTINELLNKVKEETREEDEDDKKLTGGEINCFVCGYNAVDNLSSSNLQFKGEDYEVFLESMLNYPRKLLNSYVNKFGSLQSWIHLCNQCLDLIAESRQIKQQITDLEQQLEGRQQLIIKKIQYTFKDIQNSSSSSVIPEGRSRRNGQEQALKSIREYVHNSCSKNDSVSDKFKEIAKKIYKSERINNTTLTVSNDKSSSAPNQVSVSAQQDLENSPSNSPEPSLSSLSDQEDEDFIAPSDDEMENVSSESDEDDSDADVVELDSDEEDYVQPPPKKSKRSYQKNSKKPKPSSTISPVKNYLYSCPNCPQVKDYSLERYAQHLAIHQRMPFKCCKCFEFLPDDESIRELHWISKHGAIDNELSSFSSSAAADKFVEIKFHPGKIWKCQGCFEGFFTEEDRDSHKSSCRKFQKEKDSLSKNKRILICCRCGKDFEDPADWRFHRIFQHPEVDSVSCFYCDESFATEVEVPKIDPTDSSSLAAFMTIRNDTKLIEHLTKTKHEGFGGCNGKIYEECEACGLVFLNGDSFLSHMLQTHSLIESQAYPCKVCGKLLSSRKRLRAHMLKVHFMGNGNRFICNLCGKSFTEVDSLQHHKYLKHGIISKDGEIFNCPMESCKKTFVSKKKAQRHYRIFHKNKSSFKCSLCDKTFTDNYHLKRHLEVHEKRKQKEREREGEPSSYECELCKIGTKAFTNKKSLRRHLTQVHGKVFPTPMKRVKKDPLKQEEKTPLMCYLCGAAYKSTSNSLHHGFVAHGIVPEGKQVIKCRQEGCDYKSIALSIVNAHERIHNKGPLDCRPFTCEYCGKAFQLAKIMRAHLKIHETGKDSKEHRCHLCDKGFAQKKYLQGHVRYFHEGRRGNASKKPKTNSSSTSASTSAAAAEEFGYNYNL